MSEVKSTWRYEVQHGPEGEQNYAWLYRDDAMVTTIRTHHAKEICDTMNAALSHSPVEQTPAREATQTTSEGQPDA